jgi:hypothetical protein
MVIPNISDAALLSRATEWARYLADVRDMHGRKYKLMNLLQQAV